MNRRVLLVLAAVQAVLLTASLARRIPGLRRTPAERSPASARAAFESGDPGYHSFLAQLRAAVPAGESALVFVDDPAREDEFVSYRAAYELFPSPVHVEFRQIPRPGRPISLAADDETWAAARRPGVLGMYARAKSGSIRLRRIVEDHRGRLETAPLAEVVPAPSPPVRTLPWLGGIVFVLLFGYWLAYRTGLAPAGASASVALGWVAGAGLFGWVAVMLSLGGVPWMTMWVPLACTALAIASRRLTLPPDRRFPALTGWDIAGLVLVALALKLAVAGALVPQSAWSNWDAWAIWDFKVKAALDAAGVPVAFLRNADYGFTHPEYPFSWPAVQTFLARCAGGFDTRLLRLVSPVWAACVPVLLAALLVEVGVGKGRWLIAGLVALLPAALTQSSNGYVDWPVAATTTAALVFLLRACRGAGPAWPAAFLAGLAANLKNEAAIFGIGLLLALLLGAVARKVRRGDFAAALGLWLVLVVPWRVVALAYDLAPRDFAFNPVAAIEAAPGRIFLFVQALALETLGPGLGGASFASGTPVPWSEWLNHLLNSWLILWFAVVFVLLLGWRRLWRPGARELLVVLAVQVAAAALAYILTIRDPRWLLASSLDRLLLQWVPAVVALCAALTRPSDQVDR